MQVHVQGSAGLTLSVLKILEYAFVRLFRYLAPYDPVLSFLSFVRGKVLQSSC